MKKIALLFMALGTMLVACEEENISSDNPAPTEKNLVIDLVPFYGDSALVYDSLYINRFSNRFHVDSIVFSMSDIMFVPVNSDDTINLEKNYAVFTTGNNSQAVARFPAASYDGRFVIISGVDSSAFWDIEMRGSVPEPLKKVKRTDKRGYENFVLYGRMFDPTKPLDTVPTIPLEYHISGYELADTLYSGHRNFSIDEKRNVTIIMLVDIKPALNIFDLFLLDEIKSEFNDFQDISAAKAFRDSLKFGIF